MTRRPSPPLTAVREIVELGQDVINRLAALTVPTVAAISQHRLWVAATSYVLPTTNRAAASPGPRRQNGPRNRIWWLLRPGALDFTCTRLMQFIQGVEDAGVAAQQQLTAQSKRYSRDVMWMNWCPPTILCLGRCPPLRKRLTWLLCGRFPGRGWFNNLPDSAIIPSRCALGCAADVVGDPCVCRPCSSTWRWSTRGVSKSLPESLALECEAILELVQTEAHAATWSRCSSFRNEREKARPAGRRAIGLVG